MKKYLSIVLFLLLAGPGQLLAQEEETAVVTATGNTADTDASTEVSESENESPSGKELGDQIRLHVYDLVESIVANSDDVSEEEKARLRQEFAELREETRAGTRSSRQSESPGNMLSEIGISSDGGEGIGEIFIAVLAITLIFGTPIMLVAAVLYASYRKRRLMHDTIDKYVSSGKDIPSEVLDSLSREVLPKNNLHKGLVLAGVGLGWAACFLVMDVPEAAALGLIPLFIGLAQLLVWKLENR